MTKQDPSEKDKRADELPTILLLGPPTVYRYYAKELSEKFHLLKPWESSMPLHQFLSTHAGSVKAAFGSPKCPVTAEVLQKLPELRFIMLSSTGLDHIDLHECKKRGVRVANAGSLFSDDVADQAVGLLIDVLRRISAANRFVKDRLWPQKGDYPLAHKLGGKRVGILGLGNIGIRVADRLNAFGCIISYTSRDKKPHAKYSYCPNLQELATKCEILVICCALTPQTRHMINKSVMLALGQNGIIVNIARGAIINQKDLIQCLQNREIAGAGLDNFENEPNVSEEFFEMDNVVMTPHVGMKAEETLRAMYDLAVGNLEAFFSGKPLTFMVTQV